MTPPESGTASSTPDEAATPSWHRYVAIGDSFTEGMSDPDPRAEDAYLGWADRLAVNLARRNAEAGTDFAYANLSIRGKLLDDIVGPQLDAAMAMKPDLVSMVGGGNDIMRPKVDLDAISDELEQAVRRVRESGADVILATGTRPAFATASGPIVSRVSTYACNVWGIAQRHGCYVIDLWTMRALQDPRMWGTDRLHLSTEGHKRVAQQAAWALGLPTDGDWLEKLPPLERKPTRQRLSENAQWTREYLGPWLERRVRGQSSGDGRTPKRPDLTPVDLSALTDEADEHRKAAEQTSVPVTSTPADHSSEYPTEHPNEG